MGAGADSFGCGFCRAGAVGFTAWGAVSSADSGFGSGALWAHGVSAAVSDTLDISSTIVGKFAVQSICGSGRGISPTSCVTSHTARTWGAAGASSGRC
nr:hypothetical protein [Ruminiclostridium cellobioparum]